jgi:adenosylcobinamide-GDP ribazoletransferase
MRGLLVAIGFLTRLPVPATAFGDARAQAASLAWYPLVGLLLGSLLCAFAWLLHGLAVPSLLSSALLLVAWVALTGALHLDGLADSADAWVGGLGDRDRTLEIMKDPRSGPAGVTALVVILLLKFAALSSLPAAVWPALLLAPLLARASLTAAFLWTPYVRRDGLGSALTRASRDGCRIALASSAVFCLCFGWHGLLAIIVATAIGFAWRRACMARLGGFTGDTAGALAEAIEVAVLVALAVTMR